MKKILIIIIFFLNFNIAYSEIKVAYIDVNFILTNSIVGKSISTYISSLEEKKNEEFKIIEKKLSEKEKSILANKNIYKKSEFDSEINSLKSEYTEYQKKKNNFIKEINGKKIKYTKVVLNSLNRIISNYVDDKSITIVFPKKNIVVAKKNLDITESIMEILNNKLIKIDF